MEDGRYMRRALSSLLLSPSPLLEIYFFNGRRYGARTYTTKWNASRTRAEGPARPVYKLYASCVFEPQFISRPVQQASKIAKSATKVQPMTLVPLNPQKILFVSSFIRLDSNLHRLATIASLIFSVSAHSMRFYGCTQPHFISEFSMKNIPYLSALSFEIFSYVFSFLSSAIRFSFRPRNPIMHKELGDHSQDEDNEEYVRCTIIWDDELSLHADPDVAVLHEDKMTDILDAIEDENEEDTPLLYRLFVLELLAKLLLKLLRGIKNDDILPRDIPCSISGRELLHSYEWDNAIFLVRKPRCSGSTPSD
jgi:hypothetical protein